MMMHDEYTKLCCNMKRSCGNGTTSVQFCVWGGGRLVCSNSYSTYTCTNIFGACSLNFKSKCYSIPFTTVEGRAFTQLGSAITVQYYKIPNFYMYRTITPY